jgi:hypothetical protein
VEEMAIGKTASGKTADRRRRAAEITAKKGKSGKMA